MEHKNKNEKKQLVLDLILSDNYKPLKFKELAYVLQASDKDKEFLLTILNELMVDGKIIQTPKGKYKKMDEDLLSGSYIGNKKGFGFVRVEGEKVDYFIPPKSSLDAFHNDKVLIKVVSKGKNGKRTEAEVVKVLDRGMTFIVGTFEKGEGFGFVIPDNQKVSDDIFIPKKYTMNAVTGHKVVAKITNYGEKGKSPEGEITEIIGHINDPATDILSVVRAYDLPMEFSDKVMDFLNTIPDEIDEADLINREDFRGFDTVTIDGEDAKDLDDAITLTYNDGIYKLGVHIADVTNYVKEKSPLDKEALKRGTSVYLVDSVIPMLPHKLSNGICSLNAGVDRLTLSCIMDIDKKGNVIEHRIVEGVINVNERMTYTNVAKILDEAEDAPLIKYEKLIPMFQLMKELSIILREKRLKRGSIDFDLSETKIIVDENHKPIDIKAYDRNCATKIIEDFMLAANETVAEDFFWQEIPFEYRTHEKPDAEKINALSFFIGNFGLILKANQKDDIHPKELQKLLNTIEGEPYEALVSKMTLRSMKQARYSTECSGHFGLSCKYYCHFTSPIRRYPDLQIHRIIKETIQGRFDDKRLGHYKTILPNVADDNSMKERRAEEAEREVIKLKQVEFMSDFIGKSFNGVISGVTSNNIFVELENTVEGAVNVAYLRDDFYYYHEDMYAMIGEKTKKKYQLGDKVKVKVVKCDKITKTIDFSIIDDIISKDA